MSDTTSQDARGYARVRYRLLVIDLIVSMLFLGGLQFSGLSHVIARSFSAHLKFEPLIILGYLAAFGLLHYIVTWPLHFYGSYIVEHRFGLSRMSLKQWWIRESKHLILGAVLTAILIEALYALLRLQPTLWPIWATVGWVGFSIILARIFPTLLLPIFYKIQPLQDEVLAKRLLELSTRVGLPALGAYRFGLGAETRKANAALAGLGKSRRILLSDTLLSEFTHDEIESVLAHELAHHHYQHITKMLVLTALGSWVAFTLTQVAGARWVESLGLVGLHDIAGFPMLALWLSMISFIGLPIQNGISRIFEWEADRFALTTAKLPEAFAAALSRLAKLNLADPNPPRWVVLWFHDHPPINERIHAAKTAASVSTNG